MCELITHSPCKRETGGELTAITSLNLTRPGIFFPLDRLCQIRRAFSSVAMSTALKGILLAFRMVSMREVAVMMWEDPAVREV